MIMQHSGSGLADLPVDVFLLLSDFLLMKEWVQLRQVSKTLAQKLHTLEAWWKTWTRQRGNMVTSTLEYAELVADSLLRCEDIEPRYSSGRLYAQDIACLWSIPIWNPRFARWSKIEPKELTEAALKPEPRSGGVLETFRERNPSSSRAAAQTPTHYSIVLACGCAGGRFQNDVWKAKILSTASNGNLGSIQWEPLGAKFGPTLRPMGRDSSSSWIPQNEKDPVLAVWGGRLSLITRFIPLVAAFNRAVEEKHYSVTQQILEEHESSSLMMNALSHPFDSLPNPASYEPGNLNLQRTGFQEEECDEFLVKLLLEFIQHHELYEDSEAATSIRTASMQHLRRIIPSLMHTASYALMEILSCLYYAFSPGTEMLLPSEWVFEQQLFVAGTTARVIFLETNWCWSFHLDDRRWNSSPLYNSPSPRSSHSVSNVFSSESSPYLSRYAVLLGGGAGKFIFSESPSPLDCVERGPQRFHRENLAFSSPGMIFMNSPFYTVHILDREDHVWKEIPCSPTRMPSPRNGHISQALPNHHSDDRSNIFMFGGFDGRDESSELWSLTLQRTANQFTGVWSLCGNENYQSSDSVHEPFVNTPLGMWPPRRVDSCLDTCGEFLIVRKSTCEFVSIIWQCLYLHSFAALWRL